MPYVLFYFRNFTPWGDSIWLNRVQSHYLKHTLWYKKNKKRDCSSRGLTDAWNSQQSVLKKIQGQEERRQRYLRSELCKYNQLPAISHHRTTSRKEKIAVCCFIQESPTDFYFSLESRMWKLHCFPFLPDLCTVHSIIPSSEKLQAYLCYLLWSCENHSRESGWPTKRRTNLCTLQLWDFLGISQKESGRFIFASGR